MRRLLMTIAILSLAIARAALRHRLCVGSPADAAGNDVINVIMLELRLTIAQLRDEFV